MDFPYGSLDLTLKVGYLSLIGYSYARLLPLFVRTGRVEVGCPRCQSHSGILLTSSRHLQRMTMA